MRIDEGTLLCDNKYKVLHKEKDQDIEGADAIVSTLVTAAPNYVVVHINNFSGDNELVATIQHIFDGRVKLCFGCDYCHGK